jgi:hypothetical protein
MKVRDPSRTLREKGANSSYASVFFCNACLAVARFTALGPLFFFFKRAAARSVTVIFGALAMRQV